jgi:hypothetical protein
LIHSQLRGPGRFILLNASAYFARPGPQIIDSIEILAGILHPKEFPEFASRNFHARHMAQPDPCRVLISRN